MSLQPPSHRIKTLYLLIVASLVLAGCFQSTETVNAPTEPMVEIQVEATSEAPPLLGNQRDLVFLSIEENGFANLFIFHPQSQPLTRITAGEWNDIAPALSPDGTRLAFASDRSGFWNLYVMDFATGGLTQVTNSPQYDSAPSWSPDGQWLAFETYIDDNLEIAIVNVVSGEIIPLTEHPASDHSPAWAPDGRNVAFISLRGGESDVWLANLDMTGEERYQNLSNTPLETESSPVWSRDGSLLLWASGAQTVGFSGLYIWDTAHPTRAAQWVGNGSLGVWNGSVDQVVAVINAPNQYFLTSYNFNGEILLAPMPLSGRVRGMHWGVAELPNPLPAPLAQAAGAAPTPLWSPAITPGPGVPNQRWYVVNIDDVQAPYPQLHELVDESFRSLRQRVIQETGWDALASLENAFVPLTTSLEPGFEEDWLYTGRAFAINSLMANAGWLVTLREDIGAQTYWRVYIRASVQDGSLGEPIHNAPWNLSARYDLDPRTYEQGGGYAPVPAGYWVDLTSLASVYGWERQPALPNWRTFYRGARFTTFAHTGGLSWYAAMQELYPVEALITPTRVLAPTYTPTNTPTFTPTPRPTRTPRPTATPSMTRTPSPVPVTPTVTP
jgi:TolB protein